MKARAKDFRDTQNGVADNEWDNYTNAAWCSWYDSWNTYVKSGGIRPNNRPPV